MTTQFNAESIVCNIWPSELYDSAFYYSPIFRGKWPPALTGHADSELGAMRAARTALLAMRNDAGDLERQLLTAIQVARGDAWEGKGE